MHFSLSTTVGTQPSPSDSPVTATVGWKDFGTEASGFPEWHHGARGKGLYQSKEGTPVSIFPAIRSASTTGSVFGWSFIAQPTILLE